MNKSYFRFKLWFDRLLSKSLVQQFFFLGIVLLGLFFLSWLFLHISGCHWKEFARKSDIPEFLLPLYLLIDTNAFNNLYINGVHGWALFVSSITFVVGAFIFNGAIIGLITNSIERRVTNHKEGHIHYLKSGHYIIMGYDDMVTSIISHIFEKDKDAFILLMSSAEADKIREKLRKVFDEKDLKHIIINYGHRMSKDYYNDIHLESAEQIYIIGLRTLPAHDAINVECVDSICAYLEKPEVTNRPNRIVCVFEDLDTYASFKTSDIFRRVNQLGIEFIPYNFYAGWAKQVFVKRYHKDLDKPDKTIQYPSVYGNKGITSQDDKFVHLIFVGTTNFAVAFAMEAAHVLHFSNFKKNGDPRTRITFIDINADKEKDEFITRNRHFFEVQTYRYYDLTNGSVREPEGFRNEYVIFTGNDANFLDVEFEFIKGDVFSKKVQDKICDWAKEHNQKQYLSIFLAQSNQRQNFVMGMNMPDIVYDNEIPIFIRQDRSDNFVSNLRETDELIRGKKEKNTYFFVTKGELKKKVLGGRYANIYPFGMNETAYSADENSLNRAKLINYLYSTMPSSCKFQSILALDSMPESKLWEEANEYWHDLSVALKWSNLYNAYTIRVKLSMLRAMRGLEQDDKSHDTWPLSDEEVEMMARLEHNRWNVEKLLMGFRKPHRNEDMYYEENRLHEKELIRNKKRFIHHDIRPYEQLDDIKLLDHEFSRYIPWIMKITENE